jgi:hypothetical protein
MIVPKSKSVNKFYVNPNTARTGLRNNQSWAPRAFLVFDATLGREYLGLSDSNVICVCFFIEMLNTYDLAAIFIDDHPWVMIRI